MKVASIADAVRQKHTKTVPASYKLPQHAELIRTLPSFTEDVIRVLNDDGQTGDPLPWEKTQSSFRLRSHELTVWAGANASYKSMVLSEIGLWLATLGRRVVVVSLEMTAARCAARMAVQGLLNAHPAKGTVEKWAENLGERMSFLDMTGEMAPAAALNLGRYCAGELGTQHLILDNATKILTADNDHADEQRKFVAALHRLAMDTGMHVHLVAHTRKPPGQDDHPPSRYEIAGSRTLSDQPDNVVMTWRNRAKERAVEDALAKRTNVDAEVQKQADLSLQVDKQRHAGWEGQIRLWMRRDCMRFAEDEYSAINKLGAA